MIMNSVHWTAVLLNLLFLSTLRKYVSEHPLIDKTTILLFSYLLLQQCLHHLQHYQKQKPEQYCARITALDLDRLRAGRLRLLLLRRLSLVSIGILKALATESSVIAAVPVAPAIVL